MATTTTLTVQEILELDAALPQLDSIEDGGKVVRFSYSEKTKWKIAKNLRIVKGEMETYTERRVAIVKEHSPEKGNVGEETPEVRKKFAEAHDNLLKTEVEVSGLLKLKRTELVGKKDGSEEPKNNIPAMVLMALWPILEDDGDSVE